MVQATKEHLEKHYADLSSKSFFPGLVKYMASGPVVAMVWEGKDVVKQGRSMLGKCCSCCSCFPRLLPTLFVTFFRFVADFVF